MNNKTTVVKSKDINWQFVDATDKILGRLTTDIAKTLMGKDNANFSYRANTGSKVVVTNASKIKVTGKKLDGKKYYKHTGFPGGIREEKLGDLLARKPEEVIRKAVKGMLPKNKLQKERLNNLYIYSGPNHPHEAQSK
jgi:large subunit ribosomal protein L13